MTSTFDNLASFGYWLKMEQLTQEEEKEVIAIVDEAVIQSSSRRPKKWNYEGWLSKRGTSEEELETFYGYKKAAQFSFLGMTHSYLDHDNTWHLKVLNRSLAMRIDRLHHKVRRRLERARQSW